MPDIIVKSFEDLYTQHPDLFDAGGQNGKHRSVGTGAAGMAPEIEDFKKDVYRYVYRYEYMYTYGVYIYMHIHMYIH